jgi:thiamine-phosphate pyrophosphorylase
MNRRHKKQISKHKVPRVWLMTDPRLGGGLIAAIARLPFRSGVIFRHYELDMQARRDLFRQVARICRRRGHILLLADKSIAARSWHARGIHNRTERHSKLRGLRSAPVHNTAEIIRAHQNNVDLMLLSPTFATRSHPEKSALGKIQFRRLAELCGPAKVIALGGMTARKMRMFHGNLIHGWAAIDAFAR